jgi:hypothetical protein
MAKVSKNAVINLTRTPAFFESMRLQYGSYSAAEKKLGIDRRRLAELSRPEHKFKQSQISDKLLTKLQNGISKMSPVELRTGKQYIYARGGMTEAQLRYAFKYSKKSEAGRKYFRKTVRDYYTHKTKRVLMPAISPTGKFMLPRQISPKTKPARSSYSRRPRT